MPENTERVDRRERIRISKALEVMVQGEEGVFRTKNLNATGLFLLTDKRWPVGTELTLCIKHSLSLFELRATVVHHQADGVGFRFDSRAGDFHEGLSDIINSMLADGEWLDGRRRSLRTEVTGQVVFEYQGSEVSANLRDLSREGAFILSPYRPQVGHKVCLYLPRQEKAAQDESIGVVGCTARVAHRKDMGFGLQFEQPSSEFEDAIDRILRQAQSLSPP